MFSTVWKSAAVSVAATTSAFAGCHNQEAPCEVPMGTYHIQLPETAGENTPAVVFLHGFGSSGQASISNARIVQPFLDRGYAVIAPNALRRPGRNARGWNFHPDFHTQRDEAAFFKELTQDAVKRFGLNADNMLLSGFSIGGSMTAYVGCHHPEMFKAYAPLSGNFWRPHPTECKAPVKLFHSHGWSDGTVPLEGRHINDNFRQGDVFYAMNIWRQTNECAQPRANRFSVTGEFMRRKWTDCNPDSALEFALFPGGHVVPDGWADMVLDWVDALPE